MSIRSEDLYKKHDQLIELKKLTYEKLLSRCKNAILLSANAGELMYVFEIPSFMFGSGFPIVNIKSCANYIMNGLSRWNRNIKSTFYEPSYILIDWRRDNDLQ